MEENVLALPEGENLTSWRLGRVEKALELLDQKFDGISEIRTEVIVQQEKIRSLERSRDRLVVAFSGLSTGVVMLGLQQVFNLFGGPT